MMKGKDQRKVKADNDGDDHENEIGDDDDDEDDGEDDDDDDEDDEEERHHGLDFPHSSRFGLAMTTQLLTLPPPLSDG